MPPAEHSDIFSEWASKTDVERQVARFFRPSAESRATLQSRASTSLAKKAVALVPQSIRQRAFDRWQYAFSKADSRGKWSSLKFIWDIFVGKEK